jgi:hypothetical protein
LRLEKRAQQRKRFRSRIFAMLMLLTTVCNGAEAALSATATPPIVTPQHIIAFKAATETIGGYIDHRYDSDSFIIAVNNCSSCCITNSMLDFVGKPKRINLLVRGIGGHAAATYVGTVRWSFEDCNGKIHSFLISNTYYNADSPYRLLSPQHWAREQKNGRGTWYGHQRRPFVSQG